MGNGQRITKEKIGDEVMTRSKMEPIVKDLKEFITATAKGTEHVLGAKIEKLDRRVTLVEAKIEATQHFVEKMEKRLDVKIDGVRTELSEKIDGVEKRLDAKIDGVEKRLDAKIDGVRTELSEKMDKVIQTVGSHETRLSAVEEKVETHLAVHP